ncbi:TonB-dependent receptor [Sphingobium sp. LB126]|uniref:TonB-dependent receptor n=1 Tax=Sphingobium sp. LB126 TaxID=1983755 RepID=UPI0012FD948B|nr:TonB-dependent receptor [Sphingobium sp. LB126]
MINRRSRTPFQTGPLRRLGLCSALSLVMPAVAFAQGGAPAVPQEDGGLGEIVVTAQKREQKLQDVGLSVSAFDGAALDNAGVNAVTDLAKVVPGLDITPSPSGTPVYTLRGVGFFESTLSAAPDVALYIDQLPLAVPAFGALTAFDLERVEVLKGPQGTLFGTNATGGAINLIAAKPTNDLDAGIELGFGSFNTIRGEAHISGPLSDTLKGRIAVKVSQGDEWQYSYTRRDRLGKTDELAGRILLDWQPGEGMGFVLNLNGWLNKSDPQAPQLARQTTPADLQAPVGSVTFGQVVPPDFALLLIPGAPDNNRAANWDPDYRPYRDDRFYQTALTANIDLSDTITLTSLTAYSNLRQRKASSYSGTDLPAFEQAANPAHANDFSQELRLAGNDVGSGLRWMVGGNYQRTASYERIDAIYPFASTGFRDGFTANTLDTRQVFKQWAVFGNMEYDLSERLKLKAGIRYTDSSRTAASRVYDTPGYVEPIPGALGLTDFFNVLMPAVYVPLFCPGVTYAPVIPGQSVSVDPNICVSGTYKAKLKEDNVPWSVGIDFKPNDDLLIYANISRGFKGGAFPLVNAASQEQFYPVPQEKLTAYELGFKSNLLGNRVVWNGAAFYYDYANKQARGKTVDPLFGALEKLVSIPKSRIWGAEMDMTLVPTRGLTVRLAGTYLNTRIKTFNGIVGAQNVGGLLFPVFSSFKGARLPFAPELAGSASLDYVFSLTGTVEAFLGGGVRAQTKSYGSPQLGGQDKKDATINGYATLDLRAGVQAPDERWKLSVWGRNVTNRHYWTNSLRAFDTIVRYTGRPSEYGVTLGYKF